MPSSVRSQSSRPAALRSASSNSIEMEHDVSVIPSTRANSMKEATRKSMVSWSPSVLNGDRAQTSHGRSCSPNVSRQGTRSNSVSRLLSRSQSATGLRPAGPDLDLLESNRESMKELSDFLRTKARTSR
jgi:hypothetical protein